MCTIFNQVLEAHDEIKAVVNEGKKAEADAAYERQQGLEESRRKKLDSIKNMTAVSAKFAASNLSTNSDTALNLTEDEKQAGELEAVNTINQSERKAKTYMDKADAYYKKAKLMGDKFFLDFANETSQAIVKTLLLV